MTEGQGVPISAFTTSAQDALGNTSETFVDVRVTKNRQERLVYNKMDDAPSCEMLMPLAGLSK